ncbi:MAG: hypothetical protein J6C06_02890 [Lachnospiraceae bacterium]|nr:hypothetical protein [Lachnospiraceae bacterium]
MNENGNTNMESFEETTEIDSQEVLETSEESSSVPDGENDVLDNSDISGGAESSGADSSELLDETVEEDGDGLLSTDDVTDLGSEVVQETVGISDMDAVVEQLEAQNVLLESQVMFLSMIVFILMFNICDRFISRIWSSIRSMGGSK